RRAAPALRMPRVDAGWAVFRLPRADHAQAPLVLGDFSEWQPIAMTEEDGAWVARVRVAPGAYHYAYRTADGQVMVPEGVPTVDDGFGGRSAVLVVP
ncbi:MAG TPA: glycogen-binding domain-containing protein, partial [Longimicrobium sp.]